MFQLAPLSRYTHQDGSYGTLDQIRKVDLQRPRMGFLNRASEHLII